MNLEPKSDYPTNLNAAAMDLYVAVQNFVNQYLTTGNATATTEQITKFCAALNKAKGEK